MAGLLGLVINSYEKSALFCVVLLCVFTGSWRDMAGLLGVLINSYERNALFCFVLLCVVILSTVTPTLKEHFVSLFSLDNAMSPLPLPLF